MPLVVPLESKIFHVKREAIEDLKREAAEEKVKVTTVDLITAHIWQSISNLLDSEHQPAVAISTFVEGRQRWHDPVLPKDFIGNAVVLASTPPVPIQELASTSHSKAASLVHSAVRRVTPTTWEHNLLATYQMLEAVPNIPFAHVMISSWFSFSTYETSFGCGYGKPVFACWNISSAFLPLGIAIVLPPPPSQSKHTIASVQMFVSVQDEFAKALFSDEKFLSMFRTIDSL
jgi:hypothetical protein